MNIRWTKSCGNNVTKGKNEMSFWTMQLTLMVVLRYALQKILVGKLHLLKIYVTNISKMKICVQQLNSYWFLWLQYSTAKQIIRIMMI